MAGGKILMNNQKSGAKLPESDREDMEVFLEKINQLLPVHETQLVNYLKATGYEIGLLLNFGPTPQVKRKIFSRKNLRSSA